MRIALKSTQLSHRGFALTITLVFIAVTLVIFGSIMYWISSSATVTKRNNLYNMSQAAAEGAAEAAIAQMDRDFLYQSLNNVSVYQAVTISQTNWPVQFAFSDTNGVINQISVMITPQNYSTNWVTLNSSIFSGLSADVAQCTVIATARPLNQGYNMSATVNEQIQLAAIPVFQYGVFYNMDMDFSPGQPLTMNGDVMVNGNIWMCPGATTTFNGSVSATLAVTNSDDPYDQQNLTFHSSYLDYAGGSPVSHVDSLVMPIAGANNNPTNVEAILNLPPSGLGVPNDVGYAISNNMYLYNGADIIISNSISGTNGASWIGADLTVWYSDYNTSPHLTWVTNDFYILKITNSLMRINPTNYVPSSQSTNILYAGYTFATNTTFYDYRESATVQAVQIDIAKFGIWITNAMTNVTGNFTAGNPYNIDCGGSDGSHGNKGHPIDSIYVYNSAPLTSTTLPAVRVINGSNLPNPYNKRAGLTVATAFPIYVYGEYNVTDDGVHFARATTDTTHTLPAALMGDAITILSSGWDDNYSLTHNGNNPSGRNANDDTVNAACLEGIVQSVHTTKDQYSGGLENFLRLNESWSGNTLTYNGSIVVMFPSIYATNFWIGPSDLSGYSTHNYDVPTRKWGFDANFARGQQYLPPLTPQVKAIVRGQWGQWNAY